MSRKAGGVWQQLAGGLVGHGARIAPPGAGCGAIADREESFRGQTTEFVTSALSTQNGPSLFDQECRVEPDILMFIGDLESVARRQ